MEELQYVYYRLKSLINFKGLIEKIDKRCIFWVLMLLIFS